MLLFRCSCSGLLCCCCLIFGCIIVVVLMACCCSVVVLLLLLCCCVCCCSVVVVFSPDKDVQSGSSHHMYNRETGCEQYAKIQAHTHVMRGVRNGAVRSATLALALR